MPVISNTYHIWYVDAFEELRAHSSLNSLEKATEIQQRLEYERGFSSWIEKEETGGKRRMKEWKVVKREERA